MVDRDIVGEEEVSKENVFVIRTVPLMLGTLDAVCSVVAEEDRVFDGAKDSEFETGDECVGLKFPDADWVLDIEKL